MKVYVILYLYVTVCKSKKTFLEGAVHTAVRKESDLAVRNNYNIINKVAHQYFNNTCPSKGLEDPFLVKLWVGGLLFRTLIYQPGWKEV